MQQRYIKITWNCNLTEVHPLCGSGVTSFIAEDYSKVTYIDLRLVRIEYIYEIVDFENADILFLYNMKTLNDDFRLTN